MCNKMSDVRLSNASPTVERVDARQQDNVRPPVRRSLFGSPDREEIRRYLDAAIQGEVQDFRERYNFDPVEERPLTPRNFEWQEDGDAPEFYHRPPHGSQRPQRDVDSPGESSQRDAEGSSEGRSGRLPESGGSRKRRAPGPCSGECPSKRLHTDEDDDEDESDGGASQAVKAAEEEERESGPGSSAEVR
ncbi:cyclin-dependent kinase inhibitor 1Ba [Pagrus major]|uniref:cyclin-dependent kinase inhibitor 1Ba n=1 Tax=Pagrus major TaxID=143350 RepID=UPI003CC8457A